MTFNVVIPARYASARLPGKPLADIGGKPMIVRVLERARQADAAAVWVATDHEAVRDAVSGAGGQVMMTRADHPSGTDRLAEVADALDWADEEIVVNVQGDEPLIDPQLINGVARALVESPEAAIATAAHPLHAQADFVNPNVVKVVCDVRGYAMYFSRAPIPWPRGAVLSAGTALPEGLGARRHVGIYAYRAAFLRRYAALEPSPVEGWEALEQLRALWHGFRIVVTSIANAPAPGIDTPEDLEHVRTIFARGARAE